MVNLKTDQEIKVMAEGGKKLKRVVEKLLPLIKEGVTTKEIDDKAEELIKKLENQTISRDFVPLVDSLISTIKSGVNYHILKPNIKIIQGYLEKNIPLIASVSYTALHNIQGDAFDGHDIVLSGIENGKIVYIDPEFATEELIDPDDLMFAIISRRAIATSAYLIAISKASDLR